MLTGVSLFAGVGGFDLAMQRQGVKVVASVEIDKKCQEVLAHRFPESKIFDDVTTVKGSDLIAAGFTPSTGIITGGFPCQDLSVAGKRAGLAGERSGLFWEIARLVEETQTEYFLIENVPGLLSSNKGRDFGVVIGTMADLGYSLGWRVLDAQHFGVPQRRRRVFIVGRRSTSEGVAEILFKSEGLRRDFAPSQQEGQDLARETASSFGQTGKEGVGTLRANGGDLGGGSENLVATIFSHTQGLDAQPSETVSPTLRAGGAGMAVAYDEFNDSVADIHHTLRAGTKQSTGVVMESNVRRLTPVECERLQGFPDDWTEGQSDSHRYKQMGNAVAVPVVEWIIQGISDTL